MLMARFTTAFDFYGLPSDFPGYEEAQAASDPYEKVRVLEAALRDDIGDWKFIPYLQLHEFETLLLSEPGQLAAHFTDDQARVQTLVAIADRISNPELINEGPDTAPSKRIIAEIPEYAGMKPSAGPIVTERIGLANLRARCRHFGEWIGQLGRVGPRHLRGSLGHRIRSHCIKAGEVDIEKFKKVRLRRLHQ